MRFVIILLALVLSSCAQETGTNGGTGKLQGIHLSCRNGMTLVVNFHKDVEKADLVISGDDNIYVLDNQHLGTGIAYSDGKIIYEEHNGDVIFTHPVAGKAKVTSCQK